MTDSFLRLSAVDRREALLVAADRSGRPAYLLEKDAWVVWAIDTVFTAPIGPSLVFKGGTSLSKAYRAIQRFSEDVDLTYSIRALAPDLIGEGADVPETRGQERRWSPEIKRRLPEWVDRDVRPLVAGALAAEELPASLRREGEKLFIEYEAVVRAPGYVLQSVQLEFGARSTGEPASPHDIVCDAAEWIEGVIFPTARPRVMHAERTFWEKATAIHVFCLQERLRGERFARHWHDIARLDDAGIATRALEDRRLADEVARHKSMFFRELAADRTVIDYGSAVRGALRLVPEALARKALADDYDRMLQVGLLHEQAEPFDLLMERCQQIAQRANAVF